MDPNIAFRNRNPNDLDGCLVTADKNTYVRLFCRNCSSQIFSKLEHFKYLIDKGGDVRDIKCNGCNITGNVVLDRRS